MQETVEQRSLPPFLRRRNTNVPIDIALNILARLPVKPVMRFRCVCKSWDSSITNPNFISTHLNNNNNTNKDDDDDDRGYLFHMPNVITRTMYSSSSSSNPVCTVVCDRTFNRISEHPIPSDLLINFAEIVGSFNGLLCLAEYGNGATYDEVIYLWNPSIRKFKRLPRTWLSQYDWDATGFAYHSERDDYKVVKIYSPSSNRIKRPEVEAEVYSLSSDSWTRVGISLRPNVVVSKVKDYSSASFVNGALHWLVSVSEGEVEVRNRKIILSFDVDDDKFGEIALPGGHGLKRLRSERFKENLAVFKGKLAFITFGNREIVYFRDSVGSCQCVIWVMEEYGVCESWNKLFSVRLGEVESFFGCTRFGELLVQKAFKFKYGGSDVLRLNNCVIVSLDPETLHEKDLGVQLPNIATTFEESLVILDQADGLSG
ncbi:hypothetical protein RGQ29_017183 [Quercus rubra]|uniref:F-box domain-containing protein n=1 Tax=Quercus rubra TaxID=3512 RepID=A0AAN7FML5_QUERU|nr:hypothetical protein RGQ29_017183 [Quercus rubra]